MRTLAEVLKVLECENSGTFTEIAENIGYPKSEILSRVEGNTNFVKGIKVINFIAIYSILQKKEMLDVEGFQGITEGSKYVFDKLKNVTDLEILASEVCQVTLESLVRHLKGSRISPRVEKKLLAYSKNGKQHLPASTGQLHVPNSKYVPTISKEKKTFVVESKDFTPMFISLLAGAGSGLSNFVFNESTPESRLALRSKLNEHYEVLRLAVNALGSETIYKQTIAANPKLNKKGV